MTQENLLLLINAVGPLIGKIVTDWIRAFLPKLQVWQIRLLAFGLSSGATWLTGYLSGHPVPDWAVPLIGLLVFNVNSASNEIRDFRSDKGLKEGDNAGNINHKP